MQTQTNQIVSSAIRGERARQIAVEGWTTRHDDEYESDDMLRAAVIYLWWGTDKAPILRNDGAPESWPWDAAWWKPKSRIENLIRAGALCMAEKERILRARGIAYAAADPANDNPFDSFAFADPSTAHVDHKLKIIVREYEAELSKAA